jgi:hypothetical protein
MSNRSTTAEFIEKAIVVHGDLFDYSKTYYVNNASKVIIICPIHKDFEQIARNHIFLKQGCPVCGEIKVGLANRSNTKEFVQKAEKLHDGKYDYSKVEYIKNSESINIICAIHGDFSQTPANHLSGKGCPLCATKSVGEKTIKDFLSNEKVSFRTQVKIKECKRVKSLPFDFGIYNGDELLGLIEFQGRQHYKEGSWINPKNTTRIKKEFADLLDRDRIKLEYCKVHNIPLLLIKYDDFDLLKHLQIFLVSLQQLDVVDCQGY